MKRGRAAVSASPKNKPVLRDSDRPLSWANLKGFRHEQLKPPLVAFEWLRGVPNLARRARQ
eukprot:10884570-Alexandrium_andersonii.AAC.1